MNPFAPPAAGALVFIETDIGPGVAVTTAVELSADALDAAPDATAAGVASVPAAGLASVAVVVDDEVVVWSVDFFAQPVSSIAAQSVAAPASRREMFIGYLVENGGVDASEGAGASVPG